VPQTSKRPIGEITLTGGEIARSQSHEGRAVRKVVKPTGRKQIANYTVQGHQLSERTA